MKLLKILIYNRINYLMYIVDKYYLFIKRLIIPEPQKKVRNKKKKKIYNRTWTNLSKIPLGWNRTNNQFIMSKLLYLIKLPGIN